MDSSNKEKTPEALSRPCRARYRGISVDQTPPQSFVLARDTFQATTDAARTVMPRTAGGERAGANRRRKNLSLGREAPRQTRKQQQQQQQQRQRLAQVRFSRQGNPREERKEGESVAGRRRILEPCRSRSPVHGPCTGRRSARCFSSASRALRSQAATMENDELTSRLVTSRANMAAGGATPQIGEFFANVIFPDLFPQLFFYAFHLCIDAGSIQYFQDCFILLFFLVWGGLFTF